MEILSKTERQILINQYEILKILDSKESAYYSSCINILRNGYEWLYHRNISDLPDTMPSNESQFVVEVLMMYQFIHDFIKSNPEYDEISNHSYAYFCGFDGNNESQYMGFTRFFVDDMNRFENLKFHSNKDRFNSHCPMANKYRGMINKCKSFGIKTSSSISKEEVLEILNAEPETKYKIIS